MAENDVKEEFKSKANDVEEEKQSKNESIYIHTYIYSERIDRNRLPEKGSKEYRKSEEKIKQIALNFRKKKMNAHRKMLYAFVQGIQRIVNP